MRLALGAVSARLAAEVSREMLRPVAWGLLAGFARAVTTGRLVEAMLFGVTVHDPGNYVIGAAVLVAVAALATWAARAPRGESGPFNRCSLCELL